MTTVSQSIKNIKVPESEWLTLIEGAAYTRTGYSRFVQAANRSEFPTYVKPGGSKKKGRLVRKRDLDVWVMSGGES